MSISYQLDDGALVCSIAKYCSSRAVSVGTTTTSHGSSGGAAGTGTQSPSLASSEQGKIAAGYDLAIDAGTSWNAGNWIARMNVTVANTHLTWDSWAVCQISSACGNVGSLGSFVGMGISLGSTGVKTTSTLSGSAATPSAGDRIMFVHAFNNGVGSAQSFTYKQDQLQDSPFTLGGPLPPLLDLHLRGTQPHEPAMLARM